MATENDNKEAPASVKEGDKPPLMSADPSDTNFQGFSTVDGVLQAPAPADGKPADAGADAKPAGEVPATPATADGKPAVGDDAKDGDKPTRSAQERINQAVGRQRAAERRSDALEGKVDALMVRLETLATATTPKAEPVDPAAPRHETYEYGELDPKFIKDLARHEARTEFAAQQKEADTARETREQATAEQQANQNIADFGSKWEPKYQDFDEVVIQTAKAGEWPLSATVGALALTSEVGGDVLYALAKDTKEAQRVSNMPDMAQAAWFGRQEAKYSPTTPGAGLQNALGGAEHGQRVTSAPVPLQYESKGAGNSNAVAADTTDFANFEALAKAAK